LWISISNSGAFMIAHRQRPRCYSAKRPINCAVRPE
jgi:hypothetical protein